MRAKTFKVLLATVAIVAMALPVLAHHSFSAEFDTNRRVTLTGVVTKVAWQNPHTFFYIDVKDEATGKVNNWAVEMGSPNGLTGRGWTRNTLVIGNTVTVTNAARAKDGSFKINSNQVTFPDGRALGTASSDTNTNPTPNR
jgi:hypothetical protein